MKSLNYLVLMTLAGLLASCTQGSQQANAEAMVAAADQLDKSFVEAFNKGDAAALAALYGDTPDVVSFTPDTMQARGKEAIMQANAATFSAMKGAKLELTESHQIPLGDAVIGWGLFRVTVPGDDGKSTEMLGRYTDVKAERGGKWVYLVDHGSVPLPPAPAN